MSRVLRVASKGLIPQFKNQETILSVFAAIVALAGHGWSDGKEVAFYAYDDRGDGRTAIYQFSADKNAGLSGWYYSPNRKTSKWTNGGVAFYTPKIDSPAFVS